VYIKFLDILLFFVCWLQCDGHPPIKRPLRSQPTIIAILGWGNGVSHANS